MPAIWTGLRILTDLMVTSLTNNEIVHKILAPD